MRYVRNDGSELFITETMHGLTYIVTWKDESGQLFRYSCLVDNSKAFDVFMDGLVETGKKELERKAKLAVIEHANLSDPKYKENDSFDKYGFKVVEPNNIHAKR